MANALLVKSEEEGRKEGEEESALTYENLISGLGLMRDTVTVAGPAAETGFGIARASTQLGFTIGKYAMGAPFYAAEWLGFYGASTPIKGLESIIDVAESITQASLYASEEVTKASLLATDKVLEVSGAERGETIRLFESHVESQKGEDTYHSKEALLCIAKLLGELSQYLTVKHPMKLMSGASALADIQYRHREQRKSKREETGEHLEHVSPTLELARSWDLFMRYAAGAYGYQALIFLGIKHETAVHKVLTHKSAITALTGTPEEDVIVLEHDGEMYRPGHYVAINHAHKHVVVSIRGTMRLQDVLVDLVCEQEEFTSIYDGDEVANGKVHKGFLRSAQRLANDLHEPVALALRANPGYELVLCGHSLGAGVATVLSLLWARVDEFRKRNIHAYAFAAPCTLCPELAHAPFTKRHVTSVVVGDDVVARLSLSSFRDMQRAMVALAPMHSVSNEEKLQVFKDLPRDEVKDKLFSSGSVYLLDSHEFHGRAVEVDAVRTLHSIELSSEMFSVHLPNQYMESISKLYNRLHREESNL
eukprot:CAMPEP_0203763376 /NCGR_PEP_ID=MMETSP0098-20131031/16094_1 /ASSEMBLY_ACC=CAM_ASM_000208 /TAXON_ID=96639 /ORGANISM=" , Strain NY0313808BC1" /LENGTH=535 /DNA_ID=CAMNT_0050658131 /DNA_START=1211 /DNA_END=2818 /DNA_ORIENTATION=-